MIEHNLGTNTSRSGLSFWLLCVGDMARSGAVHQVLLEEFLQNKYYQQLTLPIGVGPDDFPETLFHQWRAREYIAVLRVASVSVVSVVSYICRSIGTLCVSSSL